MDIQYELDIDIPTWPLQGRVVLDYIYFKWDLSIVKLLNMTIPISDPGILFYRWDIIS